MFLSRSIVKNRLLYISMVGSLCGREVTYPTSDRPAHPIPVQCLASVVAHCWINAGQSYSTLTQHWNRIVWLSRFCSDCHTYDALSPERPPFKLLNTNIIVNIFFSEDFLNTKVFNLGTPNVHKDWCTEINVNRFPHTPPLSPLNC